MIDIWKWFIIGMFAARSFLNVETLQEFADPSPQEIALLDWSSGIRFAYCSEIAIEKLVEPFKISLSKVINKFCRNATACLLRFPVFFTPEQIVILDGYPRRDYGAVQFRFLVVLPHDAIPLVRLQQPLLSNQILSNVLRMYMAEISRKLGWEVISYERFPRYDSITEFMNTALIPIGFILLIFMFFLAYWSTAFSRSTSGGDGVLVVGSNGGKNAALKRTMEIIEEQKQQEVDDEGHANNWSDDVESGGIDGPMSASMISQNLEVSSEKKQPEIVIDVPMFSNESISNATEDEEPQKFLNSSLVTPVPEINILPESSLSLSNTVRRSLITSGRKLSSVKNLSSFDEFYKEKRYRKQPRQSIFVGKSSGRQWKTSMALGGFRRS